MNFIRTRIVYVHDVNEFNKLLDYARRRKFVALKEWDLEPLENFAFIDDRLVNVELVMKTDKNTKYIFAKDGRHPEKLISGVDAYIPLANTYKRQTGISVPVYEDIEDIGSATALLAYRPGIADVERVEAWSYDARSAYGWAMSQPMPDTDKPANILDVVQEGQIGFSLGDSTLDGFVTAGDSSLRMIGPGKRATYIFNLMESPFKGFAERWYKKKETSTDRDERAKAKQMLCYSVGFLQRKNPFLRAAVVEHANNYIKSFIDENTIYINTDCIISTKPREDLPIGPEMGQFKVEKHGMFARSGFNYQWDFHAPTLRGVPKSWFEEGWDILKDELPDDKNLYQFNAVKLQMEEKK